MKRVAGACGLVVGLVAAMLAVPAGADAPQTITFTTINAPDAVDPCTGDPMVVVLDVTAALHEHEGSMVMHARATGATGDYELHHGNLVSVQTATRLESRLVEHYWGPDGSKIRISIKATVAADSPPDVVFTSQCLAASTGS